MTIADDGAGLKISPTQTTELLLGLVKQMATNSQAQLDLAESFDTHCRIQNGSLRALWKTVNETNDNLNRRPTWAVCIIVTLLCSVTVGLLVAITTHVLMSS